MGYIRKFIKQLLVSTLCLFLLMNSGMVSTASAADDAVDEVTQLLEEIDSLQQMQDKRRDFAVSARYDEADPATVAEHEQMQADYKAYVGDMFAKRAAAQAAYEALSAEQKDQIDPTLLAKLTDTLGTTHSTESYELIPSDNEYNYQIIMISRVYYLAYELSMHCTVDKDMPCTLILVDVSGDDTSFTPNGLYSYGTNNYEVTYCCDEREPTVFGVHYKRVNLEDCDYYNTAQAEKIRAIVLNSYPYISLEEMKANLVEAGVAHADELDRADITAAVQFAIWYYSNRMTNAQLTADTTYAYTINALSYRAGGSRPLITSFHDYRNELWYWWNANDAHDWSYDADADERVSSLLDYLLAMPGQKATDNQAVISDVQIVRTGLTDENDGTYSVDMDIIINHGVAAGDAVTMTVSTPTETKTVDLTGETVYPTTIRARYGETVNVTVEGTQHLEKGAYFYEPEGGYDASQALVGVSEGDTKVKAEKSFVFNKDIDSGLHVYKTEAEIGKPLEGIEFSVYDVTGETVSETPTEEEIAAYAVEAKLAGTMTTDSTGYASLQLPYGTYLVIEEPNESVKKPVDPFYVVLPDEEYGDIAELNLINKERDEPGTTSVQFEATKQFNDWGKAESFTFELAAVTEGAPMPQNTTAVATKDDPIAVFDSIKYTEPGTYEYTITEIDDGVDGVTYDTTPHKVVVTVTENKVVSEEDDYLLTSYSLEAETVYDEKESLIITNTFTPAEAEIEVTKLLKGREWLDADSFTVTLSAVDGAPLPETTEITLTRNAQTGKFGPIEYDKAGTYKYTVKETAGDEEYMEYDLAEHSVTVIVTKDKTNALSAEVNYGDTKTVEIVNTKNIPAPVEAEIEVTKLLEGREWLDADSFIATLSAATENAPMPKTTELTLTKAAQSGSFGKMTFEKKGTYEYIVSEVPGDEEYMIYDIAEHKVIITVTDPEGDDNTLVATVTYEKGNSVEIINTKNTPKPTEASIEVTKLLEGREWLDADSFVVTLTAEGENVPMPQTTELTLTKDAQSGTFGPIAYENVGTYEYTVKEMPGDEEYMEYDSIEHKVTITVTLDEKTNALKAEVDYGDAETVEIINTKNIPEPTEAIIEVTKLLSGREWKDADSFLVTLTAVSENAPMPQTTELTLTKAAQSGTFGPMTFDQKGTYEYFVQETAGDEEGMTYDVAQHKVIITVTDPTDGTDTLVATVSYEDGKCVEIKNYKVVDTGDHFNYTLASLLFLSSLLALSGLMMLKKKEQ